MLDAVSWISSDVAFTLSFSPSGRIRKRQWYFKHSQDTPYGCQHKSLRVIPVICLPCKQIIFFAARQRGMIWQVKIASSSWHNWVKWKDVDLIKCCILFCGFCLHSFPFLPLSCSYSTNGLNFLKAQRWNIQVFFCITLYVKQLLQALIFQKCSQWSRICMLPLIFNAGHWQTGPLIFLPLFHSGSKFECCCSQVTGLSCLGILDIGTMLASMKHEITVKQRMREDSC